jgi:hypothetical protein
MALRPQPAAEVIDLTSPSADLHIISPEPEALPTPPWFLDDLSEDLPRNPPNSPAHSSTETRHPTTTGSPQYLNIWFISSEPSPTITPSVPSARGNHTITEITPPDPLYSRHFQCDKEILEELQCPDSPGTHYIIMHSSFRRNPPCLLATIPFSRSKPKTLSPQEWSIGSITPFLHLTLSKKVT